MGVVSGPKNSRPQHPLSLNPGYTTEYGHVFLHLACGFCSISEGTVIAAFKAMASRSDSVAKLLKRRVSSVTNYLPHAPDGTLKNV